MVKGTSFASKAKGKKVNTQSFVKYVKSVKSEKTGFWRFNEQMIAVNEGENLDDALKRLENESMALDMELPVMEVTKEKVTTSEENNAEVAPSEEAEKTGSESKPIEIVQEETVEAVQIEDSSDEKAPGEASDSDSSKDTKDEVKTENVDKDVEEEKVEADEDGTSVEADNEESKEDAVEKKTEK